MGIPAGAESRCVQSHVAVGGLAAQRQPDVEQIRHPGIVVETLCRVSTGRNPRSLTRIPPGSEALSVHRRVELAQPVVGLPSEDVQGVVGRDLAEIGKQFVLRDVPPSNSYFHHQDTIDATKGEPGPDLAKEI